MSKRNREKRNRNREQKSGPIYSTLDQHKTDGRRLIPPMMTVPNVQLMSWPNDRLPEILWAAVLISHLPREIALSMFRMVASYGRRIRSDAPEPGDITHSGIAAMKPEQARELINIICRDDYARKLLKSLKLFENLPAGQLWREILQNETDPADWGVIAKAVALALDHQSQEATDCRWLKVLFYSFKGQLNFPAAAKFDGKIEELLKYPDFGDMRAVRPSIRSLEGALGMLAQKSAWPSNFWSQCLRDTGCEPLKRETTPLLRPGTTLTLISDAYDRVRRHANNTRTTTAVDPRHDVVFGTALFALSVVGELMQIGVGPSILGRCGLRTLLECYVNLAYLAEKDSPQLWNSFRVYGAGQAKLAFLKITESVEKPSFVTAETLESLANEDMYQEYLTIDLGHWEKSNLRKLSEEAEVKDEYDRYYPWTSTYSHGHWAAVRDSVFDVCGNPLHRLHRIPRPGARALNDVVEDACELMDKTLGIVERRYPGLGVEVRLRDIQPADRA
jgi:hypothetical protein